MGGKGWCISISEPEYLSFAPGVVEYAAIDLDWGNVLPYILSIGWSAMRVRQDIVSGGLGTYTLGSVRPRQGGRTSVKIK